MRVSFSITAGPNAGLVVGFDRHDTVVVGRSPRTRARIPGKDPYLSRFHFVVEVNPPLCRLVDLGSKNGTFVNDLPVAQADLVDGDVVKAGHTVFRVRIGEVDTVTHAPLPADATPLVRTRAANVAPPSGGTVVSPGDQPVRPLDAGGAATVEVPGYKLIRTLGRGGMGTVYLAVREADERTVALKTVRPNPPPTPKQVEMFFREVDVLRQLDHPNVVAFLGSGEVGGLVWFAMEYVPGRDAAAWVRANGPMPVAAAVRVTRAVTRGLAHAHGLGFVHRDVKPSNVLLERRPGGKIGVKLADFGLARVYEDSHLSGLTLTGDIGGTPAFMAPEQILDFRNVGPAADVYGAAATLYFLLTGLYIYDLPADPVAAFGMVLEADPVPVRDRRPEIPDWLADAIHLGLAKDPADRHASVDAFARVILRPD